MNPIDIALILIIATVVALAVRRIVINKKSGTCSCGCAGCSGKIADCPTASAGKAKE